MNYRKNQKNGDMLSILGYGCMRLKADEEASRRQICSAIEQGVNYFDTAYIYPNNENLLGRILPKERRQDVYIATKLPPYLVNQTKDLEKLFQTQLKRLQTDYIDYYLIHMLQNVAEWERLCSLGMLEWLAQKKANGQIRNIGFSYHGGLAEFKALIDAHSWEFCMLQFNYFDEHKQAGKEGVDYADSQGVPVMVMEPLRGGRLVNLLPKAAQVFDAAPTQRSAAEWGLRWVWNHPNILLALSGMNSMDMLQENVRIASATQAGCLSEDDLARYGEVQRLLDESTHVPCTGCNYCMPCPVGVDIPLCFSCYNDSAFLPFIRSRFQYIQRTHNHNASLCIQCGQCETHCPQKISIRDELQRTAKHMEAFPYGVLKFSISRFMKFK